MVLHRAHLTGVDARTPHEHFRLYTYPHWPLCIDNEITRSGIHVAPPKRTHTVLTPPCPSVIPSSSSGTTVPPRQAHVSQPMSVSAQQSDDKKTVVVRAVNPSSAGKSTTITLDGFVPVSASAVVMSSTDLAGENTAANVDNIAPKSVSGVTVSGGAVHLDLDGFSYTVVTLHA